MLESIDAIDLAFDTLAVALLEGEVDASGYPEYSAIVGGTAAIADEGTGDMMVRAVAAGAGAGPGGRGPDGRREPRRPLQNVLADQCALGLGPPDRPVHPAGRRGLVCAHCGFGLGPQRAFYCRSAGSGSFAAEGATTARRARLRLCLHRVPPPLRGLPRDQRGGTPPVPPVPRPVTRAFAPPTIHFKGIRSAKKDRRSSGASARKAASFLGEG